MERKAQKQRQQSRLGANHSKHESVITDTSQGGKGWETENSIELYPELGPNTPLIRHEVDDGLRRRMVKDRYVTHKDAS